MLNGINVEDFVCILRSETTLHKLIILPDAKLFHIATLSIDDVLISSG